MAEDQPDEMPATAPVMVLPGALLFPHALLPLYIFEPKYREMLAYSLANERMFCVALMRPGATDSSNPQQLLPHGRVRFDSRLRSSG